MKKPFHLIIIFVLLLIGCDAENKQEEKDIKAIKELLVKYEQAAADGDAVAYTDLFSENVVWAAPDSPVLKSKAEIKKRVQQLMEVIIFELDENTFEIVIADDFAYAISDVTGTFTQKSDGIVIPVENTALRIFRKEKDGWRISRQLWNSKLTK